MLGAGLTFNLGRDITLLVLWPVVFAYCFVRLIEIWASKRFSAVPHITTHAPVLAPASLGAIQASPTRLRRRLGPPCPGWRGCAGLELQRVGRRKTQPD